MAAIVLCCDGTWNSADQAEVDEEPCVTNVLKIACFEKHARDGSHQIVYTLRRRDRKPQDRIGGGRFGKGWRRTSTSTASDC